MSLRLWSAGDVCYMVSVLLLWCSELRGSLALGGYLRETENNATNSTQPILSAGAIANISASVVGVCVIGSVLCYLLAFFNKQERMIRVKTALERNKQIERQTERERQRRRDETNKEAEEREGESGSERGDLVFSAVHDSYKLEKVGEDSSISTSDEHKLLGHEQGTIQSVDSGKSLDLN